MAQMNRRQSMKAENVKKKAMSNRAYKRAARKQKRKKYERSESENNGEAENENINVKEKMKISKKIANEDMKESNQYWREYERKPIWNERKYSAIENDETNES